MKKRISLFLSMVILVVSVWGCYVQPVHASFPDSISNFVKGIFIKKGTSVSDDFLNSFIPWMENKVNEPSPDGSLDSFLNAFIKMNGWEPSSVYSRDDLDNIIVRQQFLDAIESMFQEYLSETPEQVDVVWVPVITEKNLMSSWFYKDTCYFETMSLLNDHNLIGLYYNESRQDFCTWINVDGNGNYSFYGSSVVCSPIWTDLSDLVMHFDTPAFTQSFINGVSYLTTVFGSDSTTNLDHSVFFIDKNGASSGCAFQMNLGKGWVNIPSNFYSSLFYTRKCMLNPWFRGSFSETGTRFVLVASSQSNIHYVPIFTNANAYKDWITGNGSYYRFDSGYAGGDLTINPNADYGKISDAIKDAMQQSFQNGGSVTDAISDMQTAFTSALEEMNNTLGNISDNTAETNSWLEKIYNKLDDIYKKLKQILFVDTVDTAFDILSGVWDSIMNWINEKFQMIEVITEAASIGNIMKTKFPFSLPWDLYAILLMLDAPANPPVIDLHFEFPIIDYEFNYQFSMDEDMWLDLATVCRFFLTIGYEISLIHLTRKLYGAGFFDVPTIGKKKR